MRKENCPDEEMMACFLEGLLEEEEREWLERHFAECESCRDIIEITKMVWAKEKNGEVLEVPKELVEWAKGLAK